MTQLTFIDMFAGIGGFRSGLEKAGHKCVGYIEWDKFACQSYQAIYDTKGEFTANDIQTVKGRELPAADIWAFGSPCTNISTAGNRQGLKGEQSRMFFEVIRLLKERAENQKTLPAYLLMENVKNLLSSNGGRDFAKVIIEMDEVGYNVEWSVIDSAEVVPQHRERIYIVGHLKNINTKQVFPINLEEDYERRIAGMYELPQNERTELSQFFFSKKKRENSICSQVQGLPKNIQLKLQKIASSKNSKCTEKIRLFSKGGLQEAQKQCKTSSCIDKQKRICQLVHLPTKEMLLLWSSRKYASQSQRYLQQQGKQIDNRSVRLTKGVSKRKYRFKLLAVQFYKEQLFISTGDGIYWTPLCIEKVEPTRRVLSDILEKIVPEKYFLSSDKVKQLMANDKKSTFSNTGKVKIFGNVSKTCHHSDDVMSDNGISKTITAQNAYKHTPKVAVHQIGQLQKTDSFGGNPQVGRVYGTDGLSPTLNTMQGGGRETKILVKNSKINMVIGSTQKNASITDGTYSPALTSAMGMGGGQIPMLANHNNLRIRKITPLEAWRLQGFTDVQFDKAKKAGVSNSQLYKQAGNAVTVPVVEAIGKRMQAKEGK